MNVISNARSFDAFAEQYDGAAALERRHDFYLRHLPDKRDSVLDVGCGTGLLARELADHFRLVVALDISAPMLAIARKKRSAPNIDYRWCDANDLPPEARFDAIVSHTTFHHFESVHETLAKLKSAVADGGRLIFIDCVRRLPAAIPSWTIFYWAYAVLRLLPDLIQRGLDAAFLLFQFRTSPAWIAHLKTDRYFTPEEFRRVYADLLPGAQFIKMKSFIGVVWTAPAKLGRATAV